jgi:hypothetical protein
VAKLTVASTPSSAFNLLSRRAAQLPHDMPRTVNHTSFAADVWVWAKLTTTPVSVPFCRATGLPGQTHVYYAT